jgi:hypothetical protein
MDSQIVMLWWVIFFVTLFLFTAYGAVLMYHWFKYSLNSGSALSAALIYSFIGSVIFIIFAAAILSM